MAGDAPSAPSTEAALPPGKWSPKSPHHKRARPSGAAVVQVPEERPLTALSAAELTRAVVAHDDTLRSLLAQLSLTFKLEPSSPLAECPDVGRQDLAVGSQTWSSPSAGQLLCRRFFGFAQLCL